ncbi:RagB/SusD family nutrient uptake outer membrane protein [Aquimarina sp. AD10]|uniref:RagB/SusD family nutrient uptake outer membrane protein n=1 Tax=Aquimarina sp. AD10 TaxID=1714849 RepID=UPI000E469DC2|nr:RagB/SusD family nutrient uptake outer membrane protein [Aquimarina sp. AD10]AXT59831.1 RagB/SusD family nutrient uptake outer membrane protein [Aquimarina sp. AD10]RKN00253.1 RagB/SusD family nutrient uptake outer membrane protein [Aquimarina sp. AD10]
MKTTYNRNRYNIRSILSFLIIASVFYSCADLDEDPTIAQLAPGAYSKIQELELGVTGVHAKLNDASWMTTFYAPAWAGDDITTHIGSNKAEFREFDQRLVSQANSRVRNNWEAIYSTIRAANTVLANNEGLVLTEPSEIETQNRLIAEVYFLRGVMFFHLARIHGRIPLPIIPDPDQQLGLAEQIDVYEQIESDLLRAESGLPDIYPGVNAGAPRPNSGSARALLARLYLDWAGFPVKDNAKYTDAASSAKQVIDNSAAHNFTLLEDLEDLWTLEHRFNDEAVWTIPYCRSCGQPNRKFGKLGNPSDLQGWQETFAEIRFFEDFPEGARKEATYRTELDWKNFSDQPTPVFKKIVGPIDDIPLSDFQTDRNDFFIRYAEVLLIYAEASARSGNITPESWEALNMIRRRSEGLPFNIPDPSVDVTTGDLAELAFTERKWEFAGEYLRWNDLVRMERVEQALSDRAPQTSLNNSGELLPEPNPIKGSLGTDNYFTPIPQREIDLNPSINN